LGSVLVAAGHSSVALGLGEHFLAAQAVVHMDSWWKLE
jgi:hypothetical protein